MSDRGLIYASPLLYKKTNTGALQYWMVAAFYHTEGGRVETRYGQDGTDSPQVTNDIIREGKNLGKKNETAPYEQAALQARQQYEKKLKSGYTPDKYLAESTDNVLDGVKPMLAHVYEDYQDKLTWPAYAQPKLDGMRCLAVITDGAVKLFTRTQKPINTVPHVVAALEDKFRKIKGEWRLDGELYNHDLKDDFNKLIGILKRDELHPEHTKAQYHIYDIAMPDKAFDLRHDVLTALFSDLYALGADNKSPIQLVETVALEDEEELQKYLSEFLSLGYEGAMYRSAQGLYEGKRSKGLLKVKTFKDSEFEIVDVEEGNGKLMGKAGAIWCRTTEGKLFKAKMKGTLDSLTDYLVNKQNYVGKKLTVKYQNLTPDKIPRFPVGMRVKEEE
jgi:DNA ligase 1